MIKPITCAVVQGDIRRGTAEVLDCLAKHFDAVILSTWDDEKVENIPKGNWDVILNPKPSLPGFNHRNYQRFSSAKGIERAEEIGATHVLKWRTDMLPTKLDVQQLLDWANFQVPQGFDSRIVTCAFRNLTVSTDWFSTIPDLFAFADIKVMKMFWGMDSFDVTKSMNIPQELYDECGDEWLSRSDADNWYCAEAELFALYKSLLQKQINRKLSHREIVKNYMYLINHNCLGICWFGIDGEFRSITQALQYPWWTECTWKIGKPIVVEPGYSEAHWTQPILRKYSFIVVAYNKLIQRFWYACYAQQNQS